MRVNKYKSIVVIYLSSLIFGCSSTSLPKQDSNNYQMSVLKIQTNNESTSTNYLYKVNKEQVNNQTYPPIFYKSIKISKRFTSMDNVARYLKSVSGIPVLVDGSNNAEMPIKLTRTGTLLNLLNEVCQKSNMHWEYLSGNIIISDIQTKNYIIKTLPVNEINDSDSPNFISKPEIDIWNPIKNVISAILTPNGKYSINQSISSITVSDRPSAINLVDKYISELNQDLSISVQINVKLLQIKLKNNYSSIPQNVILESATTAQHLADLGEVDIKTDYTLLTTNHRPIVVNSDSYSLSLFPLVLNNSITLRYGFYLPITSNARESIYNNGNHQNKLANVGYQEGVLRIKNGEPMVITSPTNLVSILDHNIANTPESRRGKTLQLIMITAKIIKQ